MFAFFRNRRRKKLLAEPFPSPWLKILERDVGHYPRLAPAEQARLREILRILIAEKEWEGARGQVITDQVRVVVAAYAALLLIGLPKHDYFSRVASVIVYPGGFEIPDQDEFGLEDDTFPAIPAEGQSVHRGPVIVSWAHARREARNPLGGQNVVIHEFTHQLDDLNGLANGTPPLDDPAVAERWRRVMQRAFADHVQALDHGDDTFFTEHAGENETEFFADATETFYCAPSELKTVYPEIYDLFSAYFRVDPLRWFPEPGDSGRMPYGIRV